MCKTKDTATSAAREADVCVMPSRFFHRLHLPVKLFPRGTWRAALLSGGSSSSLLRDLAEQFKLEASVERIKVLQASAELQYYCMQSACKEAPLVGIPAGSKPFWKPRSCALF
ncbi:guanine nucleotide-binding protein G(I)/G(S)/G(O) subunit gamma-10-like [Ursus maritimus]|uniref:Guanine nucleotide-binding protein subunit gamma n=1 Tax=Ursus maritimus TaxID=29073 RepID=A0A8M1GLV1_URSMA|nr:guanine nucleotide-binding protein G(I)/G(S)/G(O) subunit gamma-10-like [Ursus maritimus]